MIEKVGKLSNVLVVKGSGWIGITADRVIAWIQLSRNALKRSPEKARPFVRSKSFPYESTNDSESSS